MRTSVIRPLLLCSAFAASQAHGFTVALNAIPVVTPNFGGPIVTSGTITCGAGEQFLYVSQLDAPFLPGNTAAFNGLPQGYDPGFLAWNGFGTYSGAIIWHTVNPNNLGYAGGMPVGLYDRNIFGPGGFSSIRFKWLDGQGLDHDTSALYGIQVVAVPEPATMAVLGFGVVALIRRRRR